MKVSQFDGFVNNATDEILGVKGVNRENLEPMLSTSLSPNITPLIVRRNGVYYPDLGIDGFAPVWVDVDTPAPTPPVIEPLTITENGIYTKPSNIDGYNPITVNVPEKTIPFAIWDFTKSDSFTDEIRGITLSKPSATPAPYEFVNDGLRVLDDKGFCLYLWNTYAKGMIFTINFADYVLPDSHNIDIMGITSSTSTINPTIGLFYNYSTAKYQCIGYQSTSTGSTSTSTYNFTNEQLTIVDGDSISVQYTNDQKWKVFRNGTLVREVNSYYNINRGLYAFAFGSNASSGKSFGVGTIIKSITIS